MTVLIAALIGGLAGFAVGLLLGFATALHIARASGDHKI